MTARQSPFELTRIGGTFLCEYDSGLTIKMDRVKDSTQGFSAEITLNHYGWPKPYITHRRLNFLAPQSVSGFVKWLNENFSDASLTWATIIDQCGESVMRRSRLGEPVINMKDYEPPEAMEFRANPFLYEGQANLIFADGGLGKSMFAIYLSFVLSEGFILDWMDFEPGRVLYLDYEAGPDVFYRRCKMISAGLDYAIMPNIEYRFCYASLTNDIEEVQKIVADKGIDVVVVDSAGPACGGEPESAQATIEYFMALRSLRCTSLTLAHVTKAGNQDNPYGNIYWRNYARTMWNIVKSQQPDSQTVDIGLFHRKVNEGPLLSPKGLRMQFDGKTSVTYRPQKVEDIPELEQAMPLVQRIVSLLKDGARTYQEIAEALGEKDGTVASALSRQRNNLFVNLDGGRWANRMREEPVIQDAQPRFISDFDFDEQATLSENS